MIFYLTKSVLYKKCVKRKISYIVPLKKNNRPIYFRMNYLPRAHVSFPKKGHFQIKLRG